MSVPCYYHPDTESTGTCAQCGMPICALDTEMVAGKMVCRNCVAAVRARVEREMASPQPAQNYAPTGGPSGYYAPPTTADPGKLAVGIVVALVIGIVSAVAIEKIEVVGHFGLSLLYIFMGYGIGWGLHKLTGEGGPKMAGIALGIMLVSLVVGHLVMVQDILNQVRSGPEGGGGLSFTGAISPVLSNLGFMHWVLIAIGLYSCFQGMMRRQ